MLMKPACAFAVCFLLMLSPVLTTRAQSADFDPVSQDPPVLDGEFPGALERVAITSGGEKLIGRMFVAQGKGPHPTVLIARGFPDYPGNLDLAMALQRAGYNVLSFNYRGFWGSGGTYTLMNSFRDVVAAIAFIRAEDMTKRMRSDPKRIILLGYSLGGPIVLRAGADPDIRAVALIDGTDVRDFFAGLDTPSGYEEATSRMESGDGVRVVSGQAVVDELRAQWDDWNPIRAALALAGKDVLLLDSSEGNDSPDVKPSLSEALQGGTRLTQIRLESDHFFVGHRVALTRAVLSWLGSLK
jgi:uncharacterized protein